MSASPFLLRRESGSDRGRSDRAKSEANSAEPLWTIAAGELLIELGDWAVGDGALYSRLAASLRMLVATGRLAGARLPSERELSARLGVSRGTVERAYDELRSRDLFQSRSGAGTWCPQSPGPIGSAPSHDEAEIYVRHLITGERNPLDLTIAAMPAHPLVAQAREACADLVATTQRESHGYVPLGVAVLRERVADWFEGYGVPTSPDQVIITAGATQGLAIAATLIDIDAPLYLHDPISPVVRNALRHHRGEKVLIERDASPVPLRPATGGSVFTVSAYGAQGGASLSEQTIRALARAAERIRVVEDLALIDLRLDGPQPRPIAALAAPEAEVISIGSASKLFWGGLRVGWLRAPLSVVHGLALRRVISDMSSPLDTQLQVAWLLERIEDVRRDQVRILRDRRDLLMTLLARRIPGATVLPPPGGNYVLVDLPTPASTADVLQAAQREGLVLLPGSAFFSGVRSTATVRLPFTADEEVLERAVEILAGIVIGTAND